MKKYFAILATLVLLPIIISGLTVLIASQWVEDSDTDVESYMIKGLKFEAIAYAYVGGIDTGRIIKNVHHEASVDVDPHAIASGNLLCAVVSGPYMKAYGVPGEGGSGSHAYTKTILTYFKVVCSDGSVMEVDNAATAFASIWAGGGPQ